jgi:hypothetical protein
MKKKALRKHNSILALEVKQLQNEVKCSHEIIDEWLIEINILSARLKCEVHPSDNGILGVGEVLPSELMKRIHELEEKHIVIRDRCKELEVSLMCEQSAVKKLDEYLEISNTRNQDLEKELTMLRNVTADFLQTR